MALVVPKPEDARFVARCILGDGPAHHRASSWALVVLAAHMARRIGAQPGDDGEALAVALRLPPHARTQEDAAFPIALPLAPLREILANDREVEAIADALVDGPPHHALANAALVAILARIISRLPPGAGA